MTARTYNRERLRPCYVAIEVLYYRPKTCMSTRLVSPIRAVFSRLANGSIYTQIAACFILVENQANGRDAELLVNVH